MWTWNIWHHESNKTWLSSLLLFCSKTCIHHKEACQIRGPVKAKTTTYVIVSVWKNKQGQNTPPTKETEYFHWKMQKWHPLWEEPTTVKETVLDTLESAYHPFWNTGRVMTQLPCASPRWPAFLVPPPSSSYWFSCCCGSSSQAKRQSELPPPVPRCAVVLIKLVEWSVQNET